jgi:hypothetical protein
MTAGDPLLRKAYAEFPGELAGPFDHLIHHSDCEGYYVPVDFGQVIVDERLAGGYLGSSVRLLAETRRIAAALDLPEGLDPDSEEVFGACDTGARATEGWQRYGIESYVCLRLIQAWKHFISTWEGIAFFYGCREPDRALRRTRAESVIGSTRRTHHAYPSALLGCHRPAGAPAARHCNASAHAVSPLERSRSALQEVVMNRFHAIASSPSSWPGWRAPCWRCVLARHLRAATAAALLGGVPW